ncbi:hypothetical protein SDRG_15824 [Saprolegnia diclina VS20]|uniref:Uncharacterized protein n=1 Tax=Saprolegnia diclina (strain VS20) TaxID=1156394 RepID=T0PVN5_SAPDV|nr:hypothetical protein SDRG_15824 [Saprolegnia diclina VS20]EQC26336.1 hypothetical protein SDRG_15824 [Saprolegnia diclina VS20]|eukprot:XP_008620229.1 hypothetical protein SDRG_15824 [Saprolegnia diclina VS20]
MVWGTKAGVTDLVQKLQAQNTKSMYILSTRKITSTDAISLASALATHPTMEEFYISGHNLGADGLEAFANVLATNTVLRKLAVGTEALGDAGLAILCAGLAKNPASAIQELDMELKGLSNDGATALGAMLGTNKSIRHLVLARNKIHTQGFEHLVAGLAASNAVRELDIAENELVLHSAASSALATWVRRPDCSLQTINLAGNPLGDSCVAFFDALATNTSLTSMNLSSTQLSPAAWAALGRALGQNATLKTLDVSQNKMASIESFAAGLSANAGLARLVLAKTQLGDDGSMALRTPSTLVHLDLSANGLTSIGMRPHFASPLKELRVFDNALGAGLLDVLPTLLANPVLEGLDVGANALHGALAIALFEALHTPTALKTLEVGGNNLGDAGLAALEVLQERNPTLDVAIDKRGGGDEAA